MNPLAAIESLFFGWPRVAAFLFLIYAVAQAPLLSKQGRGLLLVGLVMLGAAATIFVTHRAGFFDEGFLTGFAEVIQIPGTIVFGVGFIYELIHLGGWRRA